MKQDENNKILPKFKAIVLDGGLTPKWVLEEAKSRGLVIFNSYGLTETVSMVYVSKNWLYNVCFKIAFDGKILLKGSTLFDGYIDSEKIDSAKDSCGFFILVIFANLMKKFFRSYFSLKIICLFQVVKIYIQNKLYCCTYKIFSLWTCSSCIC